MTDVCWPDTGKPPTIFNNIHITCRQRLRNQITCDGHPGGIHGEEARYKFRKLLGHVIVHPTGIQGYMTMEDKLFFLPNPPPKKKKIQNNLFCR